MTATEARRLRTEERLSIAQIQRRLGVTKHQLASWLSGVPAPEWTRRPNAKDELRVRAVELRGQGWSVNDIALELGVARSTAWLWIRHLPLDTDSERAARKAHHAKLMNEARWVIGRAARDAARAEAHRGAETLGPLNGRDLALIGAVAYWCEGKKSKPWRPEAPAVVFTNSDPVLVRLFLRFVDSCGVEGRHVWFRLAIHESADVVAAQHWWSEVLAIEADRFQRPTIKRHSPRTVRYNVADTYHGCLVVTVHQARELYWRMEGIMDWLGRAGTV